MFFSEICAHSQPAEISAPSHYNIRSNKSYNQFNSGEINVPWMTSKLRMVI